MEDKESDEEESELSDRENRPYSIVISILRKGRCNRSRVVMVPAKGHLYSSSAFIGVPASKEYFNGLMFSYLQKDGDIRLGILPLVSYAQYVTPVQCHVRGRHARVASRTTTVSLCMFFFQSLRKLRCTFEGNVFSIGMDSFPSRMLVKEKQCTCTG